MMIYSISKTTLWAADGAIMTTQCDSGEGGAQNDPRLCDMIDIGAIPRGTWHMFDAVDSDSLGKVTIPLTPLDHDAHGRTNFTIHAVKRKKADAPGIEMPLDVRIALNESEDSTLRVIE